MTRSAHDDTDDLDDIGELDVAEYLVFLLAFNTYARYVYEHKGEDYTDDLTKNGVILVRMADRATRDVAQGFFLENVSGAASKKMVAKAFSLPSTSSQSVARRTMLLRTTLKRGGPATLRGLFKGQKALREVKTAITASMMDDADAALDQLAAIPMRNARLRKWIDDSAAAAGSGAFQNPVALAASEAVEAAPAILSAQTTQAASPGTEEAATATSTREVLIAKVQSDVTEASQRALAAAGVEDKAPTVSEVHGIVAATVAAAMAAPEIPANIPAAFINNGRPLDTEQMQAALTDGRVLVAAGAGAGKSTTLVSRVAYLINDKQQDSGKIIACCFNRKAKTQLEGKIKAKVGVNNVRCATMHSLFLNFVVGNKTTKGLGSDAEREQLSFTRLISDDGKCRPSAVSMAIRNIWEGCGKDALMQRYDWMPEEWLDDGPPKAKQAGIYMNQWRGNGVTLEQAKELVSSQNEAMAYIWYENYLGLKGDIPGWRPACGDSRPYSNFMKKYRPGGETLGDMEDMQSILLNVLRRDEGKRTRLQSAFDHILVDEAQDLNLVQHEIFEIMSAKVTPTNGKSIWMIGDDKQCIYQFRGSRPELFRDFAKKEGWTTRMIRTNYRCEPEIVETANKLAAHNENSLPMECRADPTKSRGTGSITVDMPPDSVSAALSTIGNVVQEHKHGVQLEKFAVLARTNNELNDFETACIINEVPYCRKGGKGFMDASESKALLGYLDLAQGSSYESIKKSLVACIMTPNRGAFAGAEEIEKGVDEAMGDVARRLRVGKESLDPRTLLEGNNATILADAIKRPYKAKIVARARGDVRKGEYIYKKNVDELADSLSGLASDVRHITQDIADKPEQTTSDLLTMVLDGVSGTISEWDSEAGRPISTTQTLREAITSSLKLWGGEEDDEDEEDEKSEEEKAESVEVTEDGMLVDKDKVTVPPNPAAGLGAVQFLFKLAIPNENDASNGTDPSTAAGFLRKIERYRALADKLRIDADKWEKLHGDKPIPAVTLSTVHKVKGAEWENVTVLMPKGTFPMERKAKKGDPPPDPDKEAKSLEAERNLAYVALTRAQRNLKILCPEKTGTGKKGGISSFVTEAGLNLGENVVKDLGVHGAPAGAAPPDITKTAVEHSGDIDAELAWYGYALRYDRRAL